MGRSGAERADCPAVLAAGAHRTTHYAPCGLFVRTSAMRMLTKRAARAAPAAALLGAPQIAPAGSSLPRRCVIGVRCPGGRGGGQTQGWGSGHAQKGSGLALRYGKTRPDPTAVTPRPPDTPADWVSVRSREVRTPTSRTPKAQRRGRRSPAGAISGAPRSAARGSVRAAHFVIILAAVVRTQRTK